MSNIVERRSLSVSVPRRMSKKKLKERLSKTSFRESVKRLSKPPSVNSDHKLIADGIPFEESIKRISLNKDDVKKRYTEHIGDEKSVKLSSIESEAVDDSDVTERILMVNKITMLDKQLKLNNIDRDNIDIHNCSDKELHKIVKSYEKIRGRELVNLKMNNTLFFYRMGLLIMNAVTTYGCSRVFAIDMNPYFKNQMKSMDVYIKFISDNFDDDEIEDIMEGMSPMVKIAIVHMIATGSYVGATKFIGPTGGTYAQNAALNYTSTEGEDTGLFDKLSGFLGPFLSPENKTEDKAPSNKKTPSTPKTKRKPAKVEI